MQHRPVRPESADAYFLRFDAAFDLLADHPNAEAEPRELGGGHSLPRPAAAPHLPSYRKAALLIVRVLHQAEIRTG